MKSIEERVNFYTAPALRDKREVKVNWLDPNEYKGGEIHYFFILAYKENNKIKFFNDHEIRQYRSTFVKERYVDSLLGFISRHDIQFSKLPILCGDVCCSDLAPAAFTKTRASGKASTYTLLKLMNENRHWGSLKKITRPKIMDISKSFSGKKDCAMWRGTTTGKPVGIGNRLELVQKWFNISKHIDVGFSRIWKNSRHELTSSRIKALEDRAIALSMRYFKNFMSIQDLKKYKYIISVEGNDKDSGLAWKLQSNSVVFMPKPKITSWLMEESLIPNVHYIQLRDDFNDLKEKFEWCQDNQNKCKEIIKNAQEHIFQFGDINREAKIQKQVIRNTLNLIK